MTADIHFGVSDLPSHDTLTVDGLRRICVQFRGITEDSANRRRLSPFLLANTASYQCWRAAKLAAHPTEPSALKVAIANPGKPTAQEKKRVLDAISRTNMVIYVTDPNLVQAHDRYATALRPLLAQLLLSFGLSSVEQHRSRQNDGFVAIEVTDEPSKRGFIPYTNRPLNWHTDGYYNPPHLAIRAMLLHCVRAANAGGENALLDPEIAYLRLRDENPDWLAALMHPEAMTIPAALEDDGRERPASTGPVFAIDDDGELIMRYTARGRNIVWRNTAATRAAVSFLDTLLKDTSEPLMFRVRLAPGEGLLCNNVLHTRTAFGEAAESPRLVLRARFATRISIQHSADAA